MLMKILLTLFAVRMVRSIGMKKLICCVVSNMMTASE